MFLLKEPPRVSPLLFAEPVLVQSLWIGDTLSTMEQMAIASHHKHGHTYHLYSYQQVQGLPQGAILKDAREILPESEVFSYRTGPGKGSFSAFSNVFRYKLVLERGNWWVDTDVVCLKPFEFDAGCVIASERTKEGGQYPTSCAFFAYANSEFMQFCYERAASVDKETVGWGTIGPKLIAESVLKLNLQQYVVPPRVFCPVDWFNCHHILEDKPIPDESYAIHLWNEMWRRAGINKDAKFQPCIYEKLKHDLLRTA